MEKIKYVLGLDPGVSSIGWGIVEVDDSDMPVSIIDHGSVIFNSLDNDKGQLYNQVRREKRGLRRVIRRRKERLRRIKNLIINSLDVKEEDFYNFFNRKNFKQDNDILRLNIYGLENKLNLEQLTRVLINYAKNRGFKSNRKINSSSEQGEMKQAVSKIETVMDKYNCTVSKAVLIYQEENSLPVRHNTDSENGYNYGYTRKDVLDELSALLDKQIEYGVISKEFKERYIDIWSSQRDFSDGPASGPYRVNFIKTFGRCTFRSDQVRVSKACPSYEFYTLVKKLQDLKYYLYDEHGQIIKDGRKFKKYSLSKDEVNTCFDYALNNAKGLSYAKIREIITCNSNKKIEFPDLPSISDANFKKIVTKYKEKNSIRLDVKLNDKQYNEVRMLAKEASYEENIYSLKSYNNLKNQLKKIGYEYKANEIDFLDDVSMILAFAKTDKKIEEIATKGEYKGKFSVEEIEIIKKLESPKTGTGSICLSLTKELLDLMLEGNTYDESLQILGFDHSKPERHNFVGGFPTIEEIEEHYHTILTNPNVKHTLVYLRRLYNSIVEKYGTPYRVHIELARDIAKSYKARKEIENEQKENYTSRLNAKIAMAETIGLNDIMYKNYKSFSNDDILKFRLWNEQKHICVYTGEEILSSQLLNDNLVNVDHILPFSRSFDDSYSNKVLVFTKANEEKRNKTPFEWLNKDRNKWLEFKKRVNDNPYFSSKKRNNLLNEDEVSFDEFSPRSLNATSYISKLALSIFKDLLNVGENDDKVLAFKGGATSFLRKNYRLNQYTHSYESKDYSRNTTHYIIDSKSLVLSSSKTSATIEVEAKNQYDMSLKYKKTVKKGEKILKKDDQVFYDLICDFKDEIRSYFEEHIFNKDINSIVDFNLLDVENKDDNSFEIAKLAMIAVNDLKSELSIKNRDNHLHHEVDAILIAVMTRSMQLKITNFSKSLDAKGKQYIDEQTGEVFNNIDELLKKYNVDTKNKDRRYFIPQPYDNFIEELVLKVFERDDDVLNQKLDELNISNEECHVKYPSYQVDKTVSGKLHEDTIYGKRLEDGKEVVVTRTPVSKITEKTLSNIYDCNKSQKPVKEAVEKWIKLSSEEKNIQPYPIHPMTGQPIRKVKMVGNNIEKMMKISINNDQRGYAAVGSVARIQIYKRNDSESLYFVQLPIDKYLLRKRNILDFDVLIWSGQGKYEKIKYNQLSEKGYNLYHELYPGQNVHVIMNNGAETNAITVGFSSGLFEIKSIIGDQIDLIMNGVSSKYKNQVRLTVSTIKDVHPIKIDIMGNLCPIGKF